MKITIEVQPDLQEKEIIIRTPELDQQTKNLSHLLEDQAKQKQHFKSFDQAGTEYYLKLAEILFFETDERKVLVHTAHQIYLTDKKLYQLAEVLPPNFMRVAKSAILNLDQIFSLKHTFTNTLVQFYNSQKQLYVSRSYYKSLKQRLDERRLH
ncbi:LytTR family DNA-binding domain-containing protein [Liquorilactobacillus sicerae]|uniref:LytTR family DNA-binding domain-containing protein n=1 Tax=Liquorilactobacillus sicerae TaxID=1416943 RepID=UPI00248003A0|nr:LytTR family DNA-binding domain-containing protein [Liquorilactobacillus sicerae]